MTIREAGAEDLDVLIGLVRQLREPPKVERGEREDYARALAEIVNDPGSTLLLAEADGRAVGALALYICPNLSHGGDPFAVIENVIVDAGTRRRGVGAALMREAIARARAAGCFKILLTSNKERPEAHDFYRSLGFRETHRAFHLTLKEWPTGGTGAP